MSGEVPPVHHNYKPNDPARPICAQVSIFCGKNGRFWPNTILIILIILRDCGTHIYQKTASFALFFFWTNMAPNGSERLIFDPKQGGGWRLKGVLNNIKKNCRTSKEVHPLAIKPDICGFIVESYIAGK